MSYRDLPYDAEIEYLENDGSSSIDTMYHIASYNVSLEIKYMQTANTTAIGFLFYQFNDSNQYVAIYSNASNKLSAVWGNNWKASTTSSDRNIHILKLENKTLYRDGTSLFTTDNPAAFTSSDNNVHIFNLGLVILARVYWAKIHYNNELVRDLIPVRVGQVGYMYDKVSRQLFGNAGTGSFILGPDVAPGREANEVAFLESWGNQYIDTGIKPSTDTKIELKCLYCKSGAGLTNYGALIGADDRDNAYILNHSAVANFTYGLEFSNNFANPQTRLLTFDSTSSPQNMRVYDEGGSLVTTLTCIRGVFEVNQNLYLFAVNRNGTPVYGSNRILYCKIYDGDTLVRDYVPVEYNGIGYMYDKVSGLFFDNKGTGKFLFGSIAKACARSYTRRQLMMEHSGYERLSYISNEGHSGANVFPYINLGIRITPTMRLYTDVQVIAKGTSAYIHGVYSTPRVGFEAVWNSSQSGYYHRAQANSVSYSPTTAYAKTRAQLTLDKNTYTVVRGGSTFTSTVTAGDNFKTNANFCLFFATGYQLTWSVAQMRMWSFKIWDNDVLIMDLVPVRDKSTKEIGLLNVVNHRFYGAVRGTFVGA